MKEQLLKLEQVFTKAKGVSIELGLIDDADKLADIQLDRLGLIENNGEKMLKLAETIEGQGKSAVKDFRKGQELIKRLEEGAKNLGVKANTIKGWKDLKKAEDLFLTFRKRYNF